ncbi:hypothetical protein BJ912DRAFT_1146606 [Pholiota molesta]|nr:hypothetical protein BJ912DRAFT_1146606 [Pholiota molesta]
MEPMVAKGASSMGIPGGGIGGKGHTVKSFRNVRKGHGPIVGGNARWVSTTGKGALWMGDSSSVLDAALSDSLSETAAFAQWLFLIPGHRGPRLVLALQPPAAEYEPLCPALAAALRSAGSASSPPSALNPEKNMSPAPAPRLLEERSSLSACGGASSSMACERVEAGLPDLSLRASYSVGFVFQRQPEALLELAEHGEDFEGTAADESDRHLEDLSPSPIMRDTPALWASEPRAV